LSKRRITLKKESIGRSGRAASKELAMPQETELLFGTAHYADADH
jgi:hypothetical protein